MRRLLLRGGEDSHLKGNQFGVCVCVYMFMFVCVCVYFGIHWRVIRLSATAVDCTVLSHLLSTDTLNSHLKVIKTRLLSDAER